MDNENPKQQLVERLKSATNILVTVSTNPSVDQLAACIGLTLWLNKLGKHATAVFSGEIPSTLEFLKPEETLEKTTDSLRDFIISLDKSKADKLRYKVEDRVVKIFITPYRTNLSADDLEFSQGDFNVDAVVCLGVAEQQDLDNAITAHGRILHDATVMSINTAASGGLGSINWHDSQASSLCELVVDVGQELGREQLDGQIATALMTGIVAETERFSNEKTLPQTMSISAELMSAGANQQLVASKLDGPSVALHGSTKTDSNSGAAEESQNDDGTLEIAHQQAKKDETPAGAPGENPEAEDTSEAVDLPEETSDDPESAGQGESHLVNAGKTSKLVTEPPQLGGTLTANSAPEREEQEQLTDPMSTAAHGEQPLLSHDNPDTPAEELAAEPETPPETEQPPQENPSERPSPFGPPPPPWTPPSFITAQQPPANTPVPEPSEPEQPAPLSAAENDETLSQIEESVRSAHVQQNTENLDSARSEIADAINSAPSNSLPNPIEALNAQPIDLATPTPEPQAPAEPSTTFDPAAFGAINDPDATTTTPQPLIIPGAMNQPSAAQPLKMPADPTAAPPVPPPLPQDVYAVDSPNPELPKQ